MISLHNVTAILDLSPYINYKYIISALICLNYYRGDLSFTAPTSSCFIF